MLSGILNELEPTMQIWGKVKKGIVLSEDQIGDLVFNMKLKRKWKKILKHWATKLEESDGSKKDMDKTENETELTYAVSQNEIDEENDLKMTMSMI